MRSRKPGGHRSQVLADHQALVAMAFKRQNTDQIFHWVTHDKLPALPSIPRHPVQLLKGHHMIDAKCRRHGACSPAADSMKLR